MRCSVRSIVENGAGIYLVRCRQAGALLFAPGLCPLDFERPSVRFAVGLLSTFELYRQPGNDGGRGVGFGPGGS